MIGKKLINQSLVYGLASLLINGSNFFLIPFYTHYLSATEYGVVSGVTVFSTLTTAFLTFGLNGAVTRFYFDLDKDQFGSFLFTIFSFQVIVSACIAGVFIFFDGLFLNSLYKNVPYQPYLKYGLITGIMGCFATIPLATLQARSKALQYRLFTTASFILLTACMIVLVVVMRKGSTGGVVAALLSSSAMALAYTLFVISQSKLRFDLSHLRTALVFGLPLMIYTMFGSLTELSSKYFVERYISLSDLGIFNVAQQIASVLILVTNAVNMAWTPIFYEEAKKDETSEVFTMFGRFLIYMLTFLALGISLYVPELVTLFVSPEYAAISMYVPVLVLAYVIGNGYWILIINPLSYSKKTIVLPLLTILSGLIAVGLNILLINKMGVMGAAAATLLTYIALIALAYYFFKRFSKVRYNMLSMHSMVLVAVLLYLASTAFTIENILLSIAFKALFLLAFYVALWVLKIYSIADVVKFVRSRLQA